MAPLKLPNMGRDSPPIMHRNLVPIRGHISNAICDDVIYLAGFQIENPLILEFRREEESLLDDNSLPVPGLAMAGLTVYCEPLMTAGK